MIFPWFLGCIVGIHLLFSNKYPIPTLSSCQKRGSSVLYIKRDADGNIIQMAKQSSDEMQESLDEHDPEILKFLNQDKDELQHESIKQLEQSDIEMIRAVEDLIELLIHKHVITFTDLPAVTQTKILSRKKIRDLLREIM